MRATPSQPVTVSLPASLLADLDAAAQRMGATRSELVRAAVRQHLRQLDRDEALLRRARAVPRVASEAELARRARAGRRARQANSSA